MAIDWQRVLPVIVSILIIIAVAILRNYSKDLSAIIATMPINVPLAMWVVSAGDSPEAGGMTRFTETMMLGLPPTFVFLVVAYLAARAGWPVGLMILAGYGGWAVSLVALLAARGLLGR